jgi:hypothetical protein
VCHAHTEVGISTYQAATTTLHSVSRNVFDKVAKLVTIPSKPLPVSTGISTLERHRCRLTIARFLEPQATPLAPEAYPQKRVAQPTLTA